MMKHTVLNDENQRQSCYLVQLFYLSTLQLFDRYHTLSCSQRGDIKLYLSEKQHSGVAAHFPFTVMAFTIFSAISGMTSYDTQSLRGCRTSPE